MVRLTGYDFNGDEIVTIYCGSYEEAEEKGNDYCTCGRWFNYTIYERP